jgi:hypothetical protein
LINGALATDVAGLGGYTMWDQHLYFAGTLYRSDHVGRCSAHHRNLLLLQHPGRGSLLAAGISAERANRKPGSGRYGMHVKSTPGAVTGLENSYTDFGPDIQYDRTIGKDVLSLRATMSGRIQPSLQARIRQVRQPQQQVRARTI